MDIKDIGQLDRRITLRTPTETTDAFGQSVRVYADNGQVWAAVNFAPGDEGEESILIIDRIQAGECVEYEDMESLDDMALADVRRVVDLVEEPGTGYRAWVTR